MLTLCIRKGTKAEIRAGSLLGFCRIFRAFRSWFPIFAARVSGAGLPSIIGSINGLSYRRRGEIQVFLVPKYIWEFPSNKKTEAESKTDVTPAGPSAKPAMSLVAAWAPYAAIAVLLLFSRIPAIGVKAVLNSVPVGVSGILGVDGVNWSFVWAYNPGIFPFMLVAMVVALVYGLNRKEIAGVWGGTVKQLVQIAIALFCGVAMVQVMMNSNVNTTGLPSMLTQIAITMSELTGRAFPLISPFIGALGAFVSGSCTVSSVLFSSLQFQTATMLALPPAVIVALQISGGAIGNMICINNVVAVTSTAGARGTEGKIIILDLIPMAIYCLISSAVAFILIYFA
jgi:lactate permease